MVIISVRDLVMRVVVDVKNFYSGIDALAGGEDFKNILKNKCFRLERIVSVRHQAKDGEWYNQEEDEWAMLLKGKAKLKFQNPDETILMAEGDYIFIPKHRLHQVSWTAENEKTVWLSLFFQHEAKS